MHLGLLGDRVTSALEASGAIAIVIGFVLSIAPIVISIRLVLVFARIQARRPGPSCKGAGSPPRPG